ncbi:hypothetical protein OJF2_45600 [Aquisphaera giovannonii]|uniref:DUF4062 domain-containing protein n=1 Tax=Aquisphaera giovannonii TaxID=406548 RepID=A0A5B9W5S8_9BACT|nr:DUF4062 domain-containing protein [Aquisphaera giovannonii]QEH36002.1 hypothetical protein OJF2_45600 [Aquisphaera giovannonii]
MPYHANVIRIFIASPGDVNDERRVIREEIHEWNVRHSERERTVLLPVGWETHATPEMGERPQAIINRQVLVGCDLLLAVLWTRIGSPTGVAQSGTIEEIQEHLLAKKPARIYFSSRAIPPDLLDYKQRGALDKFKARCRANSVYDTYSTLEEFRSKLNRHLAIDIPNLFPNPWDAPKAQLGETRLPPPTATLSERAIMLLKKAAMTDDGQIMAIQMLDGYFVQVGNENVARACEGREKAEWKAALSQLERNGLIEAIGYDGDAYEVTAEGHRLADQL